MSQAFFGVILFFYLIATLYVAFTTPISPHEAYTFFYKDNFDHFLMHLFDPYLEGFIAFRLPVYLFGVLNILLYYQLSKFYFKEISDRYWVTVIFIVLPGVIASMVLVNISVVVISLVLLFLVGYHQKWLLLQIISMGVLLFVHDSAVIFFVSVLIYSYFREERELLVVTFLLLLVALYMGYFEIGGRPRGHFLEVFGLYAAIFSPFVFVYFCYSLYRTYYEKKHDILWYIAVVGLLFSLTLSIRQRVTVTEFAPYILIGVFFIYRVYIQSLRVRLQIYQKRYHRVFIFIFVTLLLGSITIVLHKPIFLLFEDKSRHFAYPIYEPYWLAQDLKADKVECYDTKFIKKAAQLQYYGISSCDLQK
jgi:hypothetical protein